MTAARGERPPTPRERLLRDKRAKAKALRDASAADPFGDGNGWPASWSAR